MFPEHLADKIKNSNGVFVIVPNERKFSWSFRPLTFSSRVNNFNLARVMKGSSFLAFRITTVPEKALPVAVTIFVSIFIAYSPYLMLLSICGGM